MGTARASIASHGSADPQQRIHCMASRPPAQLEPPTFGLPGRCDLRARIYLGI